MCSYKILISGLLLNIPSIICLSLSFCTSGSFFWNLDGFRRGWRGSGMLGIVWCWCQRCHGRQWSKRCHCKWRHGTQSPPSWLLPVNRLKLRLDLTVGRRSDSFFFGLTASLVSSSSSVAAHESGPSPVLALVFSPSKTSSSVSFPKLLVSTPSLSKICVPNTQQL